MKTFIAFALVLSSFSSFANMHNMKHEEMEKKMDSMSFDDAKKMKTDMLAEKKTMIEEAQTCVNSAKDKSALKSCTMKMHENMGEMHSKMKDEMKDKTKKKM